VAGCPNLWPAATTVTGDAQAAADADDLARMDSDKGWGERADASCRRTTRGSNR